MAAFFSCGPPSSIARSSLSASCDSPHSCSPHAFTSSSQPSSPLFLHILLKREPFDNRKQVPHLKDSLGPIHEEQQRQQQDKQHQQQHRYSCASTYEAFAPSKAEEVLPWQSPSPTIIAEYFPLEDAFAASNRNCSGLENHYEADYIEKQPFGDFMHFPLEDEFDSFNSSSAGLQNQHLQVSVAKMPDEADYTEKHLVNDFVRASNLEESSENQAGVCASSISKLNQHRICVGKWQEDSTMEKSPRCGNAEERTTSRNEDINPFFQSCKMLREFVHIPEQPEGVCTERSAVGHIQDLAENVEFPVKDVEEHSPLNVAKDEYSEIIGKIVQIAKDLPKNKMLDECLDSFSGRVTTVCGNAILYRLCKERLFRPALSFFDWMRVHTPSLLDSRSLCAVFTMLGDIGMVDRAIILFNNMKECTSLQSVQVYNAILSTLFKHGRYDEALMIFQEMAEKSIEPDCVTFSTLIASAWKNGSALEDVWRIFRIIEREVFASHSVFGALVNAVCKNGLQEEALMIISEMERRGLKPNVVVYNTVIDAYGKANMLEEAEGLLFEMKEKRICPSVVTYNSLIDAYGKQGNFEAAEALLQEMTANGLMPNVRSYTPLIVAYGRHLLWEKAVGTFMRMRRNGVHPNTFSYSALIHAYAEYGWHDKAYHAFENMLREGLVPSVEVYTSLLHGYRQAGDIEGLANIWRRMREAKCYGTRVTYNVLMDAYAKQGCYGEARDVMYEFSKLGYKPDRKTYNILLYAYARGGRHSKVPDILKEMRAAGFLPDSFTYTTLIFTFLRVRDFTAAFMYHDMMCKHHQLPDKLTYLKLRAILDIKFEAKMQGSMSVILGLQRKKYDTSQRGKKVKRFLKRRRPLSYASSSTRR